MITLRCSKWPPRLFRQFLSSAYPLVKVWDTFLEVGPFFPGTYSVEEKLVGMPLSFGMATKSQAQVTDILKTFRYRVFQMRKNLPTQLERWD